MRVIFFDCECVELPGTPKEAGIVNAGEWSFGKPWELGLAVAATTSKEDGGKQWLGEDAGDLIRYFGEADAVVGFNSLRFDFPLVDGEASFRESGAYMDPMPTLAEGLEGDGVALIDMLLDVWDSIGKRVKGTGLKPLAVHTLGKEAGMTGDLAPVAWAEHRKAEVISYCADDVEWSRELFNAGLNGPLTRGHPKDPTKPGPKVDVAWNIRTAAGEVVEPFVDWYGRHNSTPAGGSS